MSDQESGERDEADRELVAVGVVYGLAEAAMFAEGTGNNAHAMGEPGNFAWVIALNLYEKAQDRAAGLPRTDSVKALAATLDRAIGRVKGALRP